MADTASNTTFTDQEWRSQPISILKVESRARYVIHNAGIENIGQLIDWLRDRPAEILRTPNFGRTSFDRLKRQLSEKKVCADSRLTLLEEKRADTVRQLKNLRDQLQKKQRELESIEQRIAKFSHA